MADNHKRRAGGGGTDGREERLPFSCGSNNPEQRVTLRCNLRFVQRITALGRSWHGFGEKDFLSSARADYGGCVGSGGRVTFFVFVITGVEVFSCLFFILVVRECEESVERGMGGV